MTTHLNFVSKLKCVELYSHYCISIQDLYRILHFTLRQNGHTWHNITDAVKSFEVDCKVKINVVSIFRIQNTTTKRGAGDNSAPPILLYFDLYKYYFDRRFNDTVWPEAALQRLMMQMIIVFGEYGRNEKAAIIQYSK
jgi:hypothetical protein